jgi:hypothetical protein
MKKGYPRGITFYISIFNRSHAGLAASTVATEASAHIAATPGRSAGSEGRSNGEGKGEDHDNLSHFRGI